MKLHPSLLQFDMWRDLAQFTSFLDPASPTSLFKDKDMGVIKYGIEQKIKMLIA